MSNVIEQIHNSSFLYDQPWFYNNKLVLRCELGIGDGKEYMKNSVCRSIQIANVLFENKKIDAAFYHLYYYKDGYVFDTTNFILNDDKIVELEKNLLRDSAEFDEDLTAINRHISYNIDFSTLESVLKSQIECQINPLVSFVSIDNDCIFSVYDDRGCDIVFFSVAKYKEFYLKLEKYFLDYDREKMREIFESV